MAQILQSIVISPKRSKMVNGVIQAENGDYIVVGRTYGKVDKAFAIRLDAQGNTVWEQFFQADYSVFFQSVCGLKDGSIVAAGSSFYSEYSGDEDAWIVKLDEDGNKIAEKSLGSRDEQNDAYDITATSDGGFIVTALALKKDSPKATSNTWVIKFDKNFDIQWEKQFSKGIAHSVIQTKDGGYALCGAHQLPTLFSNPYVLRLDANGNMGWEHVYEDYKIYVLIDSGMSEDADGNLIMASKTSIIKLNSSGNVLWERQSDDFRLTRTAVLPDGNYAFGGSLAKPPRKIDRAYLAVINSEGTKIISDNSEMVYPSGITRLILDKQGFLTASSYLRNTPYLSVFDFSTAL